MLKDLVLSESKLEKNYPMFKIARQDNQMIEKVRQYHLSQQLFREMCFPIKKLTSKGRIKIYQDIQKYVILNSQNCTLLQGYYFPQFSLSPQPSFLIQFISLSLRKALNSSPERIKDLGQLKILTDLTQTVIKLHKIGITHNQLELNNIFISRRKVIIGLPYFSSIQSAQRKSGEISKDKIKWNIYQAPELFQGYLPDQRSDIWSLGMVFFQLQLGEVMEESIWRQTMNDELSVLLDGIENLNLKKLLIKMLQPDPSKRIQAKDIKKYLTSSSDIIEVQNLNELCPILNLFPFEINDSHLHQEVKTVWECQSPINPKLNVYHLKNSQNGDILKVKLTFEVNNQESNCSFLCGMEEWKKYNKCQFNFTKLIEFIEQGQINLTVSVEGDLLASIPKQILDNKKLLFDQFHPQTLQRVKKCMVEVTNSKKKVYDGLMIGMGIVLTSSQTVNYQLVNTLIVNCKMNQSMKPQKVLSESFKLPKGSPDLHDYVVVSMKKQIKRRRYITLVSDYTEEQTVNKLNNTKAKIDMHYQAGHHTAFHPYAVSLLAENRFKLKVKVKDGIKRGCPLIVVFSNNQCFSIGMFDSDHSGYLFDNKFFWYIWNSLYQKFNLRLHEMTTRMVEWSNINLEQIEPPYINPKLLQISKEGQQEYLPQNHELSGSIELYKMDQLRQQMSTQKLAPKKYQQMSQDVIKTYKKCYGSQSQIVISEYYQTYKYLLSKKIQLQKQAEIIHNLANIPRKHHKNMLIYMFSIKEHAQNILVSDRVKSRQLLNIYHQLVQKMGSKQLLKSVSTDLSFANLLNGKFDQFTQFQNMSNEMSKDDTLPEAFEVKAAYLSVNLCLFKTKQAIGGLHDLFILLNKPAMQKNRSKLREELMKNWIQTKQWLQQNFYYIENVFIDQFMAMTNKFVPEKIHELIPMKTAREARGN